MSIDPRLPAAATPPGLNATRAGQPPAANWLPLLREALAQRGSFTLPLRGDSMRPTLPTACDIEIAPLDREPAVGQLVVFALGDALVAHRLVRKAGPFWIAQGDNRRGPDRALRADQVLGRVVAARVEGRWIWPGRFEKALATLWLARHQALRAARWAYRRAQGAAKGRR